jgi:isochorismate hydrolase
MSKSQPLISPEDCVLVFIDAQEKLLQVMAEKELVIRNLIRLAEFSRIMELPVVVAEQNKLGPTLPAICEALGGCDAVGKITFGCFGSQAFNECLEELDRNTLILAGVETHICIHQTAMMGLRSHRVQVVCDATSARDLYNKEIALKRLVSAGVELSTVEMLIYELIHKAGTEEFRRVRPLVK